MADHLKPKRKFTLVGLALGATKKRGSLKNATRKADKANKPKRRKKPGISF